MVIRFSCVRDLLMVFLSFAVLFFQLRVGLIDGWLFPSEHKSGERERE